MYGIAILFYDYGKQSFQSDFGRRRWLLLFSQLLLLIMHAVLDLVLSLLLLF